MAKSKLVEVNKKIEDRVVGGYKKIEDGVVGGYKKIESGVIGGFNKISDKFVDNYLTKDGETVVKAKERLAREQKLRVEESNKEMDERKQHQQETIEKDRNRTESHRF